MTICPESRKTNCEKHVWILQQVQASAKLGMSEKIPRGEALLRRMSGASPTRCLTSPATSTPSATHNFLYKTSKTAPKGAVFLIFSAIVITVFCCNNDVLLEKKRRCFHTFSSSLYIYQFTTLPVSRTHIAYRSANRSRRSSIRRCGSDPTAPD